MSAVAGPPWWRDRWAWASVLAVLPLVLHSLGAPLGEPVADDWDFVSRALFGRFTLLDGGGSTAFWRPLSHQVYYGLIARAMLAQPLVVPVVHVLVLAATTLLFYRTIRTRLPAPWAAAAASFPLIAESARALIAWPGHMVELSFLFFSALALHEAAFRRLPGALIALACALLSKEVAVATSLMLPWLPNLPAQEGRRGAAGPRLAPERLRWIAGAAAVTLVWAIAYLMVRRDQHLELPHGLESGGAAAGAPWLERYRWTVVNAVRTAFSLPVTHVPWELAVWLALAALVGAALWIHATRPQARARLAAVAAIALAGVAWFALTLAPSAFVYPLWIPHRAAAAAVGLGVALACLLGSARPALLVALVAVRLVLFAASPGPPGHITMIPPDSGAFLDFAKLTRLQRLMRETRAALAARAPSLPHGARVVMLHPPLFTEYAYGGHQALAAWYRDSTLRWTRYDEFRLHPEWDLAAALEFQEHERPQLRLIDPAAMRHYLSAGAGIARDDWSGALGELARAEAAQPDSGARAFRSRIAGRRAFALLGVDRFDDAEREAHRGLALWRECSEARYALAALLAYSGRAEAAHLQLDTLLMLYPHDRSGAMLRDSLRTWALDGR